MLGLGRPRWLDTAVGLRWLCAWAIELATMTMFNSRFSGGSAVAQEQGGDATA